MRIAIFTVSMNKGGTERVISNLCNEYLVNRHEVFVITYLEWNCEYGLDQKIRTYSLGNEQKKNVVRKISGMYTAGRKYVNLMERIRPDVVLAFLPRPCLVACTAGKKLGIPVIGSIRSNPERNFPNPLYRTAVKYIFDRADGFVFQTETAKSFFHVRLQEKSTVIMNPVSKTVVCRQYHGERSKRIVSVGRFTEEKNYPLLIRAFAGLDRIYDEYTLWIYGKQDESLGIKKLAESLGVAERVVFAGQTDDIYDAIYDASLFVLSSKSEGVPNALMEAMAMGIPVVATDCPCGGPRVLIKNRENGILVPNEDEEALVNAMNEMLADSGRALQMGEKARDIGIRYSGQKIYREWEEYILSVVNKGEH